MPQGTKDTWARAPTRWLGSTPCARFLPPGAPASCNPMGSPEARGWTLAAYSPRSFRLAEPSLSATYFTPHQDRAVVILLMFHTRGSDSYYVAKNSRSLNSYR